VIVEIRKHGCDPGQCMLDDSPGRHRACGVIRGATMACARCDRADTKTPIAGDGSAESGLRMIEPDDAVGFFRRQLVGQRRCRPGAGNGMGFFHREHAAEDAGVLIVHLEFLCDG
jgi:hypothetical protein